MWMFDLLIANPDRHLNNALITSDRRLVLIDNSRAFKTGKADPAQLDQAGTATRSQFWMTDFDPHRQRFPTAYDPFFIERLGQMDEVALKAALRRYVNGDGRRWILERRDAILQTVEIRARAAATE